VAQDETVRDYVPVEKETKNRFRDGIPFAFIHNTRHLIIAIKQLLPQLKLLLCNIRGNSLMLIQVA